MWWCPNQIIARCKSDNTLTGWTHNRTRQSCWPTTTPAGRQAQRKSITVHKACFSHSRMIRKGRATRLFNTHTVVLKSMSAPENASMPACAAVKTVELAPCTSAGVLFSHDHDHDHDDGDGDDRQRRHAACTHVSGSQGRMRRRARVRERRLLQSQTVAAAAACCAYCAGVRVDSERREASAGCGAHSGQFER